jgi:hypothetical protein
MITAAVALLPAVLVIGFMDYFRQFSFFGFNALNYTDVNAQLLVVTFLLVLACVNWPKAAQRIVYAVPAAAALYGLACFTSIQLSEEDSIAETAVDWLSTTNASVNNVYSNHPTLTYFHGLKKGSYDAMSYDSTVFNKMQIGDIIVYDTHYGDKIVDHQTFNRNKGRYQIVKEFGGQSPFRIFLLQTVGTP